MVPCCSHPLSLVLKYILYSQVVQFLYVKYNTNTEARTRTRRLVPLPSWCWCFFFLKNICKTVGVDIVDKDVDRWQTAVLQRPLPSYHSERPTQQRIAHVLSFLLPPKILLYRHYLHTLLLLCSLPTDPSTTSISALLIRKLNLIKFATKYKVSPHGHRVHYPLPHRQQPSRPIPPPPPSLYLSCILAPYLLSLLSRTQSLLSFSPSTCSSPEASSRCYNLR